METADYKRFREIMAGMSRVFGTEMDDVLLDVYWMALRRWPLPDFERATAHLLETCQHMPRPADYTALARAGAATGAEAWGRVLQHCEGGYRERASLDDGGPIDQAVGALGGYRQVAMTDMQFLGILERRFAEHYETQVDAGKTRGLALQITATEGRTISLSDLLEGQSSMMLRRQAD